MRYQSSTNKINLTFLQMKLQWNTLLSKIRELANSIFRSSKARRKRILILFEIENSSIPRSESLRNLVSCINEDKAIYMLNVLEDPSVQEAMTNGFRLPFLLKLRMRRKIIPNLEKKLNADSKRINAYFMVGEFGSEVNRFITRHKIDFVIIDSYGKWNCKDLFTGNNERNNIKEKNIPVCTLKELDNANNIESLITLKTSQETVRN